jgi:hypothetical protein
MPNHAGVHRGGDDYNRVFATSVDVMGGGGSGGVDEGKREATPRLTTSFDSIFRIEDVTPEVDLDDLALLDLLALSLPPESLLCVADEGNASTPVGGGGLCVPPLLGLTPRSGVEFISCSTSVIFALIQSMIQTTYSTTTSSLAALARRGWSTVHYTNECVDGES